MSDRLIGRLGPERRQMLPRAWALPSPAPGDPGVDDVEHLCRAVLITTVRAQRMHLSDADWQEALAYLLGEVVVLRARYVPAPGRELGPYLYQRLRWKTVDFFRAHFGRNGRHRLPQFEQRDDGVDDGVVAGVRGRGSRLDEVVADPTDDWDTGLGGLEAAPDRGAPRNGDAGGDERGGGVEEMGRRRSAAARGASSGVARASRGAA